MKGFVAGASRASTAASCVRLVQPTRLAGAGREARAAIGEDAMDHGIRLRGASNAKARKAYRFAPRRLEWLSA